MADHNNAKDAVTAWLNESEGFSLRIERLHEDAASGNDLMPWLVEAFRLGADRAAPEGQVWGYTEIADIIDRNITDETVNGRHRLLLEGEWHEGPVVDWVHKTLTGIRDLLRKYAALTPPPVAPTDNTALVMLRTAAASHRKLAKEQHDKGIEYWRWNDWTARKMTELAEDIRAVLNSREAPPAAQTEAVAWKLSAIGLEPTITSFKDFAELQKKSGWKVTPLYDHPAAPAPGIAEAARVLIEAQTHPSDVDWQRVWDAMRPWADEKDLPMAFNKALRTLEGWK